MLTQKLSAYALIPRASTPCQFSLKDEAALVRKANGCPRARLTCPAPPRANRPLRRTRVGSDSTLHQLCCSPRVRGPVRAASARRYVPSTTARGRFSHYKRREPQAGMVRHDSERCDSPIDVQIGDSLRFGHSGCQCWRYSNATLSRQAMREFQRTQSLRVRVGPG